MWLMGQQRTISGTWRGKANPNAVLGLDEKRSSRA